MSYHLYLPDAARPRHRQLKRLILAIRDMQFSAIAIEAAIKLPRKDKIRLALISSAVVAYSRPFSSGRNWGRLSSKWEKFEDPELQDTHRFIDQWRDSVVAHTDEELNDVEFIPKGSFVDFKPDGRDTPVRFTIASHGEVVRTPEFPSTLLEPFLRMCQIQVGRMKKMAKEEKNSLFDEFILPAPKKANKALEPTPTSVTPPAAQEPRQP